MKYKIVQDDLKQQFIATRRLSVEICSPLAIEDYVPQPTTDVSPPKWHLAHSSWFFEQFVLVAFYKSYKVFDSQFSYLFNSYYNNIGSRTLRENRGFMSRPSVQQILDYRVYVNEALLHLMENKLTNEALKIIELGIHHEQQHQELLVYDIKYILGHQPLLPIYGEKYKLEKETDPIDWIKSEEGIYKIGADEDRFCFDNELQKHKVYIHSMALRNTLVTNKEYIAFIKDGAYKDFNLWHEEGWNFIQKNKITKPLYWHEKEGEYHYFTLQGLKKIDKDEPIAHLSFYEAAAFAQWAGYRLPTEFEWEVNADKINWGKLWEWTNSAYLPYPYFEKSKGALGEYNGKFMLNQNVLRGASIATPEHHSRKTYRNFFHASARWVFSGVRLAKDI